MKVVGLCGGSGSGKGAASSFFKNRCFSVIDTDAVYRELTSSDGPCIRALSAEFGKDIISNDGSLNRKALGKIVFQDIGADSRLKKLNEITHKFILDEVRKRIDNYRAQGCVAVIVDAPVLFESGFDAECDIIVAVIADKEIRIRRIMERDNIDRASAEARIDSQLSDHEIASRSNIVICNNFDLSALDERVGEAVNLILNN